MATNWKKILQAGALGTDALSKGSAGGLGKAIVDSKIDLSGKPSETTTSGASNGATDIKPFDSTNTKDAEGGDLVSWKKMKKANYI